MPEAGRRAKCRFHSKRQPSVVIKKLCHGEELLCSTLVEHRFVDSDASSSPPHSVYEQEEGSVVTHLPPDSAPGTSVPQHQAVIEILARTFKDAVGASTPPPACFGTG